VFAFAKLEVFCQTANKNKKKCHFVSKKFVIAFFLLFWVAGTDRLVLLDDG